MKSWLPGVILLLGLAGLLLVLLMDGEGEAPEESAADLPSPTGAPDSADTAAGPGRATASAQGQDEAAIPRREAALEEPAASTGDGGLLIEVRALGSGAPIEGALCRITRGFEEEPLREARTDPEGRAQIAGLSDRRELVLRVSREGFLSDVRQLRSTMQQVRVTLEPGLAVRGQVLDAVSRQPLAGVRITAYAGVFQGSLILGLRSDAQGRFVIPGVPPDRVVTLEAELAGYQPLTEQFPPDRLATGVRLLLGRGARIEGTVFDRAGFSVADARVRLVHFTDPTPGSHVTAHAENRTTTDADGFFRFEGVDVPGVYRLAADSSRAGTGQTERFELKQEGSTERRDLHLGAPAASVLVEVLDPDGSPVEEVRLSISTEAGVPPPRPGSGRPDWDKHFEPEDGRFRYGPLDPGRYLVRADRSGWVGQEAWVDVRPEQESRVTLRFDPGQAVLGTVTDGQGDAVVGIEVQFRAGTDPDEAVDPARTETDAEGRFSLAGLAPEPGELLIGDPFTLGNELLDASFAALLLTDVTPGGPPLEIVLQAAPRIIGRIRPVPERRLVTYEVDLGTIALAGDVTLDASGGFELSISRVDAPFQLVLVPHGGMPFLFEDLVLAPAEVHDLGELQLEAGLTLGGRVTGSDGQPLAEADVEITFERWFWGFDTVTDADGVYRLTNLPRDAGEVSFWKPGYLEVLVEFGAEGPPHHLDAVLERTGALEGQLLDDAGAPRAGVRLLLSEPESERDPFGGTRFFDLVTDEQGRFEDEVVLPGRYFIFELSEDPAGGEPGLVLLGEVAVEEGKLARVVLPAR